MQSPHLIILRLAQVAMEHHLRQSIQEWTK